MSPPESTLMADAGEGWLPGSLIASLHTRAVPSFCTTSPTHFRRSVVYTAAPC
jgi:hypothetical protein